MAKFYKALKIIVIIKATAFSAPEKVIKFIHTLIKFEVVLIIGAFFGAAAFANIFINSSFDNFSILL